ncbi:MAG TPA: hypothetical protein VHX67_03960 [Acidimicrobiales bacterium]|nr:hypothetical protein [Acidimicrobiales bacterium]
MLNRTPGSGAYARTEREQRWLLSELPEGVTESVEIQDRYFTGSTLRLRRMRSGSSSSSDTVHKLGQKVRVSSDSPERVSLTNMYLTQDEFALLEQLDGASLTKTR